MLSALLRLVLCKALACQMPLLNLVNLALTGLILIRLSCCTLLSRYWEYLGRSESVLFLQALGMAHGTAKARQIMEVSGRRKHAAETASVEDV